MKLQDLQNKRIAILGLGIENVALVDFLLKKKVDCEITICDFRNRKDIDNRQQTTDDSIKWKVGEEFNKGLDKFDIMFRSPGWPVFCPGVRKALKAGVTLYSPMRLFFDLCPTKNIIGITGSKGKGTTSSLIYHILKTAKKKVYLGGNIGVAPFGFLPKLKKTDWVVLELSSFQLEDMAVSPHISVITNFTPEHLAPADPLNRNYHRSLAEYWKAKANIFKYNKKEDYLIINKKMGSGIRDSGFGKIIKFGKSELKSKLVGEHNKENIAAAVEVAKILKIKDAVAKKAVASFKGLEHRLEFVTEKKGVRYYNDTFATIPEATITAIKSFDAPIILLVGGSEKKSDFSELVKEIKKLVKFVVLIVGATTVRLKKELIKAGYPKNKLQDAGSMAETVSVAKKQAETGDIVLLSPAAASFGIFKNYKDRGEQFKREVLK